MGHLSAPVNTSARAPEFFWRVQFKNPQLEDFAGCQEASILRIEGNGILSPSRARRLSKLDNLREIELHSRCKLPRAAFNQLVKCKNLEKLTIWEMKDKGRITAFANDTSLKSVKLVYPPRSEDIAALAKAHQGNVQVWRLLGKIATWLFSPYIVGLP